MDEVGEPEETAMPAAEPSPSTVCQEGGEGGVENGFVCGAASLLYGMQVQSVGKNRYIQKKKQV